MSSPSFASTSVSTAPVVSDVSGQLSSSLSKEKPLPSAQGELGWTKEDVVRKAFLLARQTAYRAPAEDPRHPFIMSISSLGTLPIHDGVREKAARAAGATRRTPAFAADRLDRLPPLDDAAKLELVRSSKE